MPKRILVKYVLGAKSPEVWVRHAERFTKYAHPTRLTLYRIGKLSRSLEYRTTASVGPQSICIFIRRNNND